jgi:alkanesulfonate monooxygenase SsuD/methylene tetrahydromethanopterin reductase-like flavin-dependent oxidoreductase (luciferase family)
MHIGMTLPTMIPALDRDHLLAWARGIDAGPFDTLAAGERITFPNAEMLVSLSAAAAVTMRVEIMPTIVVLPLHSAALMAKQIATLDVLSGGRVTVGVGLGGREEDFRAVGASFSRRLARMADQVATMRRAWSGEPVVADSAPIGPAPLRSGGPQVLVGALTTRSIERAATWADGVIGFGFGPDRMEIDIPFATARAAWAAHGRPAPRLLTSCWYALGPDGPARMDAYARRYLGIFGDQRADALTRRCRTTSAAALREAIHIAQECGADGLLLVPTTADPADLDRAADIVG